MNLFAIAILFSGMIGGEEAATFGVDGISVSRESVPRLASGVGSTSAPSGRGDPRQPEHTAAGLSSVGARPVPSSAASADSLKSGAAVFADSKEPARLAVRSAAASVPVNPIIGPTGGVPGDIVLLDASQAKAKAYAWDCIPLNLDAQGKPLTTIVALGDKAIVSSRPGTRTAILSIVRDDGTIALFQWTITISGAPPTPTPVPIPPDPPKPPPTPEPVLSGIAKVAHDEAMKLSDRSKAPAMAQAFRGLVQKIMDGAVADDVQAIGMIKQATNSALGPQADLWRPWGNAVGAALKVRDPNTPSEWAAACEDVATGLEAVK